MKIKTLTMLLVGALVACGGSRAFAQEWAEKMFEKREHDFGVVAKGADARYRLKITNAYKQPVHIASVTTTCGCSAAKPSKDTLVSLESAYIEIVMDTRKFSHQKDSNVIVTIDQPLHAEVRIPIHAYIRTDVVLTPGGAEFPPLSQGEDKEYKIDVAYAGRGNWKIKNVVSKNPNVTAKVVETRRDATNVNYSLLVTVKGTAPLGDLREQLTLVTDDAGNPNIPVLVTARVDPEFVVNPDIVSFGNLTPGEKKTVNVVVRAKKQFSIEKIESEKSSGTYEVRLPKDAKQTHVVALTVVAPNEPGSVDEQFSVTIAGRNEPVTFKAHGKVVAGTASTGGGSGASTASKNNP
ncbi:MAG: DUF1573 domain-containing protein [Planctomycetia bacterium]|nr:DUF1573 domain-containing protein [Planctomycetia bacterium]